MGSEEQILQLLDLRELVPHGTGETVADGVGASTGIAELIFADTGHVVAALCFLDLEFALWAVLVAFLR